MTNIDVFQIYSQFNQSETTYVSKIHKYTPRGLEEIGIWK